MVRIFSPLKWIFENKAKISSRYSVKDLVVLLEKRTVRTIVVLKWKHELCFVFVFIRWKRVSISGQCIGSLVCLQINHQDCILENFMSHCFNSNRIRSVVNGQVLYNCNKSKSCQQELWSGGVVKKVKIESIPFIASFLCLLILGFLS